MTKEPNHIQEIHLEEFGNETLVLTSCTSTKATDNPDEKYQAKDLYQGTIFNKTQELCERSGFDYRIISAKHGFLEPQDEIGGYNERIESESDISELRPDVVDSLSDILPEYDEVLLIAGKKYRRVIEPLIDDRFYILKTEGYGYMVSAVDSAIPEE